MAVDCKSTSKHALFPRLRRQRRARILRYDLCTAVARAVLPCTHETITIFRGALEPSRAVHEASEPRDASPRVHESLKQYGNRVRRRRVERVMRENGIGGGTAMRYRPVPGLTRLFTKWGNRTLEAPVNGPDRVGVAGLRYLRVRGQWRDLAPVMDRCSRKVSGWRPGPSKTGGLTRRALRQAIAKR